MLQGLPCLEQLNLSHNSLGMLPSVVPFMTSLVSLNLTKAIDHELPLGFSMLLNLRTLILTEAAAGTVPDSIRPMSSLAHLNLSGNVLRSLPNGLYMHGLTYLSLADNNFAQVPATLWEAKCLRVVQLSGNPRLQLTRNAIRMMDHLPCFHVMLVGPDSNPERSMHDY